MKLFLTSSTGCVIRTEEGYFPREFDKRNQFDDRLRAALPEPVNCLMISSDPDDKEMNRGMKELTGESFRLSNIDIKSIEICERHNCGQLREMLAAADLVYLCGGHVPTQNRFFKEINLAEYLQNYHGVIVGVSAGSMNCASVVYAQPELEGEAADPAYKRFISGLGLTDITILPHYQELAGATLDGLGIIADIGIPDSYVHAYYALPDGSYVLIENGKTELYGDYYYICGGAVKEYKSDSE